MATSAAANLVTLGHGAVFGVPVHMLLAILGLPYYCTVQCICCLALLSQQLQHCIV